MLLPPCHLPPPPDGPGIRAEGTERKEEGPLPIQKSVVSSQTLALPHGHREQVGRFGMVHLQGKQRPLVTWFLMLIQLSHGSLRPAQLQVSLRPRRGSAESQG